MSFGSCSLCKHKRRCFCSEKPFQKAQSFLPTLSCYSVLSCCTTCPIKLTLWGKFQQPSLGLNLLYGWEPATSTRDEIVEYCIHHYGSPVSFLRPPQCLVPSLPDQVTVAVYLPYCFLHSPTPPLFPH